ncbi:transposase-like protein [Bradyrhizobium sp. GM22.5]
MLRQAWELDADKAKKLIRNLAPRVDQQWPGVAATILQGLEEVLTVVRLKVPTELRRSLASTKIAENMMGTIRRVTRDVKGWRDAGVAFDGPRPA